ncbi:MAG: hypothetical protein HY903_07420 [Deltaproteobacteria bacterium]|nr:hypothetical protein [Deltaproteobacteria bacterium]
MNRTSRAFLFFAAALAALIAAFAAGWDHDTGDARSTAGMAIVALLVVTAIVLVAVGVNAVLAGRDAPRAPAGPRASYRHTVPLFLVVGVTVTAALTARSFAVPSGFGAHGYFRGTAPTEARDFPLRHAGKERCAECHEDELNLHDKDAHAKVPCETCHGPGAQHADASGDAPILVPRAKEDCLVCHRILDARPGAFPQISLQDHYRFVGVKDDNVQCIQCHSPHEPLYMDRDLRTARLHPLIHRCRDCHIGRTDETLSRPEAHPAIFECSYCHKTIVADAAARKHRKVSCTTCHIFFRDSDFAGRIIRDADPRFCLLCHRKAAFRSDTAAPGIDWPAHLKDVGKEGLKNARCIDCHQDRIHTIAPRSRP